MTGFSEVWTYKKLLRLEQQGMLKRVFRIIVGGTRIARLAQD